MQRNVLFLLLMICLPFLGACEDEPRVLTTEEYILLNQPPPLWLAGIDFVGADLRGVDLSNADLRGAKLNDADLRNANLSGANLLYADLRGADLTNVDLRGANLRGTNFSASTLSNINVADAEYSRDTRWRTDFDAEGAGAVLVN